MWSYPGPRRRRFGRLALERRSVVASPETVGLAWLWVYLWVWLLFDLLLSTACPYGDPSVWPRMLWYLELWLGDFGAPANLQLSVMAVQVLMVIYLWLRYRGLRHRRRVSLAAYLLLAGVAVMLLLQQQLYLRFSQPELPRVMIYPQTPGPLAIPDPTPETP